MRYQKSEHGRLMGDLTHIAITESAECDFCVITSVFPCLDSRLVCSFKIVS